MIAHEYINPRGGCCIHCPLCHAESVEVIGAFVREAQMSGSMTGCHVGAPRHKQIEFEGSLKGHVIGGVYEKGHR